MNTVFEFMKKFPTDDACLDHLMVTRYGETTKCPKCQKEGKFSRIKNQPAYACSWCGHHIHPMAGTIFQDSKTPLQKWFYAMYLFTTSRHGVPAKEIQRQISVTYKTAWRMCHQIRKYMGEVDGDAQLSGTVELDETFIGGAAYNTHDKHIPEKTIVFGMVQRKGEVMTKVVDDHTKQTLFPIIKKNVKQFSKLMTDEMSAYRKIGNKGYLHQTVNHLDKEYVRGDVHTNTIEGFWSQLKRSIRGTHVHVSKKHMPKYLGEFEFRYNRRNTSSSSMFDSLLRAF
jgi:transposase